tara:strand:- start:170 stop:361 length:192 start_codon:yes stop_codon:yes gene_type:complete
MVIGIFTMGIQRLLKAEKTNGRIAMAIIPLIATLELSTGTGIISALRGLDIQSMWWMLGIYAA